MVMGELSQETELLVIGSGPGGYAAAFRAADLGLDVTIVEPEENPGGANPFRQAFMVETDMEYGHISQEGNQGPDFLRIPPPVPSPGRCRPHAS